MKFVAHPAEQFQIIPAIALVRISLYITRGDWFDVMDDLTGGTAALTEPKLGRKKSIAAFLPSGACVEYSQYTCAHMVSFSNFLQNASPFQLKNRQRILRRVGTRQRRTEKSEGDGGVLCRDPSEPFVPVFSAAPV